MELRLGVIEVGLGLALDEILARFGGGDPLPAAAAGSHAEVHDAG